MTNKGGTQCAGNKDNKTVVVVRMMLNIVSGIGE